MATELNKGNERPLGVELKARETDARGNELVIDNDQEAESTLSQEELKQSLDDLTSEVGELKGKEPPCWRRLIGYCW